MVPQRGRLNRREGSRPVLRLRRSRYCRIIEDAQWVCTINEPNILVLMAQMSELMDAGLNSAQLPVPDERIGELTVRAHPRAIQILRASIKAKLGWTVAQQALIATPGNEELHARLWEDLDLEAFRTMTS